MTIFLKKDTRVTSVVHRIYLWPVHRNEKKKKQSRWSDLFCMYTNRCHVFMCLPSFIVH